MEAIRKRIKRNGKNKITIELPSDFKSENIELLIFPVENSEMESTEFDDWENFSITNLDSMYNKDEPDYTNVMINERNPNYEGSTNSKSRIKSNR